ncbi:hypothetical protein ACFWC6_32745 [Micromonospora chalcea]
MPGSTALYGLPYLELTDAPDIAGATQDLAEAVETELQRIETTSQPVAAYQSANDTSTSTSYVAGTDHGVAFAAPATGKVYVSISGSLGTNTIASLAGAFFSFEVRAGGTVGSGSVVQSADDARSTGLFRPNNPTSGFKYAPASGRFLVAGLTPGSTYNVRTMFRTDTGGATAAVLNRTLVVEPVL